MSGDRKLQPAAIICENIRDQHAEELAEESHKAITEALLERAKREWDRWDEKGTSAVEATGFCCDQLLKFSVEPEQEVRLFRLMSYVKLEMNDTSTSNHYLEKVMAADPSSINTHILRWAQAVQSMGQGMAVQDAQDSLRHIVASDSEEKHSLLCSMGDRAQEFGQHELFLQCLQEQFLLRSQTPELQVALLTDMVKISENISTAAAAKVLNALGEADIKMIKAEADENALMYLQNMTWNLGE